MVRRALRLWEATVFSRRVWFPHNWYCCSGRARSQTSSIAVQVQEFRNGSNRRHRRTRICVPVIFRQWGWQDDSRKRVPQSKATKIKTWFIIHFHFFFRKEIDLIAIFLQNAKRLNSKTNKANRIRRNINCQTKLWKFRKPSSSPCKLYLKIKMLNKC